jgi:hypothetical protein
MTTLRRRLLSPHALAWVLWLALLLPLAQLAASGHGLAHTLADGANTAKQAAHLAQCDLCLAAAAVSSGAATAAVIAPPLLSALRHAAPLPAAGSVWAAPAPRAYSSRAPPDAPH